MKDSGKKWAGWLALAVIVVAAGVALAITNTYTEEPIAQNGADAVNEQFRTLFPEADEFVSVQSAEGAKLYSVKQNGTEIGQIAVTTAQGYGGPIEIVTGLESAGKLRGVGVGGASFAETEGLGAKSKDAEFTDQFKQKTPPVSLGGDIDAISGATITSRAVVDGVNAGVALMTDGNANAAGEGQTAQKTANASVIGYAGPVLVRLSVDESGGIASLDVGAERFLETEGLGARTREESFTQQFIGKKPPLAITDIDAISGATISSQAVVDAVNEAYAFVNEK